MSWYFDLITGCVAGAVSDGGEIFGQDMGLVPTQYREIEVILVWEVNKSYRTRSVDYTSLINWLSELALLSADKCK